MDCCHRFLLKAAAAGLAACMGLPSAQARQIPPTEGSATGSGTGNGCNCGFGGGSYQIGATDEIKFEPWCSGGGGPSCNTGETAIVEHGLTVGAAGFTSGGLCFCGSLTPWMQYWSLPRYEYVCRTGLVSGPANHFYNTSTAYADFSTVEIGQSADRLVTLKNNGMSRVEGDVVSSCPEFALVGNAHVGIDPGQTANVTVRFTPTCDDVEFAELAIGTSYYVLLQGTGHSGKLVWGTSAAVSAGGFSVCSYSATIATGATRLDFAFDSVHQKLYTARFPAVGTTTFGEIVESNADGSGSRRITTSPMPWSVDIDPVAGKVYWAEAGRVKRANLDGTGIESLPIFYPSPSASDIAIDPATGQIYWTEVWTSTTISRANLDGTHHVYVATLPGGGAPALALDRRAGKLYWTQGSTIRRVNTDGTNPQTLLTPGIVTPVALAVEEPASHLYWADGGTNSIHRVNLDGTAPLEYFAGTAGLKGLTLVSPAVLDLDRIYWTDGNDRVRTALKNGTSQFNLVSTGLNDPRGMALDVDGNRMYWADPGTDKIQRADLSGGNVQDLVMGITQCQDVALDVPAGKMYWVDSAAPQKIQRANLDGTNVETVLATGLFGVRGIAIDGVRGKMYWTEVDAGGDGIYRANLNGTNVETLVPGLVFPVGIALDPYEGKMYWADFGTGKIERANFDGSQRDSLVTGLVDPRYLELDLGARKMYWTDTGTGKIQRANLDGTGVEDIVVGLTSPVGIAVTVRAGFPNPSDAGDVPLPPAVQLDAPHPNPFNPSTSVSFRHAGGRLELQVYSVAGRLMRTLVRGEYPAGASTLQWDGTDDRRVAVASGLYVFKLRSGGQERTAKAVLVR